MSKRAKMEGAKLFIPKLGQPKCTCMSWVLTYAGQRCTLAAMSSLQGWLWGPPFASGVCANKVLRTGLGVPGLCGAQRHLDGYTDIAALGNGPIYRDTYKLFCMTLTCQRT